VYRREGEWFVREGPVDALVRHLIRHHVPVDVPVHRPRAPRGPSKRAERIAALRASASEYDWPAPEDMEF
jgi:hypothetical protein